MEKDDREKLIEELEAWFKEMRYGYIAVGACEAGLKAAAMIRADGEQVDNHKRIIKIWKQEEQNWKDTESSLLEETAKLKEENAELTNRIEAERGIAHGRALLLIEADTERDELRDEIERRGDLLRQIGDLISRDYYDELMVSGSATTAAKEVYELLPIECRTHERRLRDELEDARKESSILGDTIEEIGDRTSEYECECQHDDETGKLSDGCLRCVIQGILERQALTQPTEPQTKECSECKGSGVEKDETGNWYGSDPCVCQSSKDSVINKAYKRARTEPQTKGKQNNASETSLVDIERCKVPQPQTKEGRNKEWNGPK